MQAEGDIGEYKSEMVVVGEVSMSVTMAEFMEGEEMKNEKDMSRVYTLNPHTKDTRKNHFFYHTVLVHATPCSLEIRFLCYICCLVF